MNAIRYTLVLVLCMTACQFSGNRKGSIAVSGSDNDRGTIDLPVIEFDATEHDFGRVHEGEQVGWFFKFRNTGMKDLLITNASSSCGCTVPDYSKTPVRAGEEGELKVIFDSKGRNGMQSKTITVESNAGNNMVTLTVTAEIINK